MPLLVATKFAWLPDCLLMHENIGYKHHAVRMYMQFTLGGSAMHISACIGSMCFPTECGLARVARRGDGQFVIRPQPLKYIVDKHKLPSRLRTYLHPSGCLFERYALGLKFFLFRVKRILSYGRAGPLNAADDGLV